jgi:hypothetical protein
MDEMRGLLLKVGGAMVALVVFAVGMKFGCGSCDDPAKTARGEALRGGCTAAGFDPLSPKFSPCMERAKSECKEGGAEAIKACAEQVGQALR